MRWTLKTPGSETPLIVELIRVDGEAYTFRLNQGEQVRLSNPQVHPFSITCDQISLSLEAWRSDSWRATLGPQSFTLQPLSLDQSQSNQIGLIKTQMPGRVLKILVQEGETIKAHQTLVIMEAMKMENEIRAPASARIKCIHVREGSSVESNANLVELEPVSTG